MDRVERLRNILKESRWNTSTGSEVRAVRTVALQQALKAGEPTRGKCGWVWHKGKVYDVASLILRAYDGESIPDVIEVIQSKSSGVGDASDLL